MTEMRNQRIPCDTSRSAASAWVGASALVLCFGVSGCGDGDTRRLAPVSVALADSVPPVYDDGELTIYEAKSRLMLPIIAPSPAQLARLSAEPSDPFERQPWVTRDDIGVQVTWTLSNLDTDERSIWVMIDPYNEFGRYEPAIVMTGDEAVRDLSGIDMLFLLPGAGGGASVDSRVVGTFTFDDMDELALDFATVFKILEDAAPSGVDPDEDDPRSTLVNYAFNVRNRSYNSPLLDPYRPPTVPGLIGFDFGVRSFEPANVALEIVVEIRDRQGDRVAERGQAVRLLDPPALVISSGAP
jgi:hypothetical protein